MTPEARQGVHEATLAVAARTGFAFSVEEVARAAGVSRATLYRAFPGGRDQLITDAVRWEVGRFFSLVHEAVHTQQGLGAQLEAALVEGHHRLVDHEVLQVLLRRDPHQLVAELEPAVRVVADGLQHYLVSLLHREQLAPGVEAEEAAEYLARLFLAYLAHGGTWDLEDREQVHRLVTTQFVAGILAPPGATDVTSPPGSR